MTRSNTPRPRVSTRADCRPARGDFHSLSELARHYVRHHRVNAAAELRCFAEYHALTDAIAAAALAKGRDGKRLSHQRRIPAKVLEQVRRRLVAAERDLASSQSFAELHDRVEALIRLLHGVGELMVYDTALRIGAKLKLEPEAVYLHAGTRNGARSLGLSVRRASVPAAEFPRSLRRLRPREIEDLLCIYKDELARGDLREMRGDPAAE
jgi:hypothetical protein